MVFVRRASSRRRCSTTTRRSCCSRRSSCRSRVACIPARPRLVEAFAFAVFLAPGVAPLVVGNPMNMIVAEFAGVSFHAYARVMAPIALVGATRSPTPSYASRSGASSRATRPPPAADPRCARTHRAEKPAIALLLAVFAAYPIVATFGGADLDGRPRRRDRPRSSSRAPAPSRRPQATPRPTSRPTSSSSVGRVPRRRRAPQRRPRRSRRRRCTTRRPRQRRASDRHRRRRSPRSARHIVDNHPMSIVNMMALGARGGARRSSRRWSAATSGRASCRLARSPASCGPISFGAKASNSPSSASRSWRARPPADARRVARNARLLSGGLDAGAPPTWIDRGLARRRCPLLQARSPKNQSREWFAAHKDEYEDGWNAPMKALMTELHDALDPFYMHCDLDAPKVFRISSRRALLEGQVAVQDARCRLRADEAHRQVHRGPRGDSTRISASARSSAPGTHRMDGPALARFRAAIVDEKRGKELTTIAAKLAKKGYAVESHETLKRVPKGFDPEHPRAALLKMKGLVVGFSKVPKGMLAKRALLAWMTRGPRKSRRSSSGSSSRRREARYSSPGALRLDCARRVDERCARRRRDGERRRRRAAPLRDAARDAHPRHARHARRLPLDAERLRRSAERGARRAPHRERRAPRASTAARRTRSSSTTGRWRTGATRAATSRGSSCSTSSP